MTPPNYRRLRTCRRTSSRLKDLELVKLVKLVNVYKFRNKFGTESYIASAGASCEFKDRNPRRSELTSPHGRRQLLQALCLQVPIVGNVGNVGNDVPTLGTSWHSSPGTQ